ncbi:MAG: type IV pilus modification protein PilV [Candidatus Competibacteraceae bacterium]
MISLRTRLFNRGFTLLEVLIAIVVLSIGLLGVAALQMVSLKNNQSTLFHSQASVLAYDIIDRMRVNRKEVANYTTSGDYWDYGSSCATQKLSGTEMYKKDINNWLQTLCKRLPSGKGKITIDSAKSQIEVSVKWDDSRGTGQTAGSTRELKVESQYCSTLPCNF